MHLRIRRGRRQGRMERRLQHNRAAALWLRICEFVLCSGFRASGFGLRVCVRAWRFLAVCQSFSVRLCSWVEELTLYAPNRPPPPYTQS